MTSSFLLNVFFYKLIKKLVPYPTSAKSVETASIKVKSHKMIASWLVSCIHAVFMWFYSFVTIKKVQFFFYHETIVDNTELDRIVFAASLGYYLFDTFISYKLKTLDFFFFMHHMLIFMLIGHNFVYGIYS